MALLISSICGCTFFILLMDVKEPLASGKNTSFTITVSSQDGDAEIAEQLVEDVEQPEERLGEEPEPAPIDRLVEIGDALDCS